MPRISDERRAANRAVILDAARRCFARDGFHQTSMPDLVAEAGISAGAFYRYFASKEEIVREIAHETFVNLALGLVAALERLAAPSVSDVVQVITSAFSAATFTADGREIDLDVQARVAVDAWGAVLRDEGLRREAGQGLGRFGAGIAEALARGQVAGRVPAGLDVTDGAALVVSLLPGLILRRAAFGTDATAVGRAAAALLDAPGAPRTAPARPRTLPSASSPLSQE
ncbi:MAG TPA: TetR family transcriptional regulator [Actinomycetospora sp.]|nr:TetR family transcriptional regulator [Actinomycetospora sp.]